MAVAPDVFVREFLSDFYEHAFVRGRLNEDGYFRRQAALLNPALEECAAKLFLRSPSPVKMPGRGFMRLIHLREMDGSEFPFLLAVPRHRPSRTKPVTCFVGHRFLKDIEGPLRFNLKHVFNPHGIDLKWSAQDLSASHVFHDIIKGIGDASMCFFDNLGTANKPNVYIEIGIACALRTPTIVAEYIGSSSALPATDSIPSDLQGLFRIQYTTYEQLFRELYFGLPNFISKNRVRGKRRSGR